MGKLPRKRWLDHQGVDPPQLGEHGQTEADAEYSKSMALLLATFLAIGFMPNTWDRILWHSAQFCGSGRLFLDQEMKQRT